MLKYWLVEADCAQTRRHAGLCAAILQAETQRVASFEPEMFNNKLHRRATGQGSRI